MDQTIQNFPHIARSELEFACMEYGAEERDARLALDRLLGNRSKTFEAMKTVYTEGKRDLAGLGEQSGTKAANALKAALKAFAVAAEKVTGQTLDNVEVGTQHVSQSSGAARGVFSKSIMQPRQRLHKLRQDAREVGQYDRPALALKETQARFSSGLQPEIDKIFGVLQAAANQAKGEWIPIEYKGEYETIQLTGGIFRSGPSKMAMAHTYMETRCINGVLKPYLERLAAKQAPSASSPETDAAPEEKDPESYIGYMEASKSNSSWAAAAAKSRILGALANVDPAKRRDDGGYDLVLDGHAITARPPLPHLKAPVIQQRSVPALNDYIAQLHHEHANRRGGKSAAAVRL